MPVGWKHSYAGIIRKALHRNVDVNHFRVSRSIARRYELPNLPPRRRQQGEIWAIFMVKNEADVIGHTIRHAIRQGVDQVLVVDNGSSDGTLDILQNLARSLPVYVGLDHEVAYYQSEKMTYLARWAGRRGADWIIPMDADEFWFAREYTLGEYLRVTPADMLEAEMFNLFPTRANPLPSGIEGELRFDHAKHILGKTALRAHPLAWLSMGNHQGIRPGLTAGGLFIAHLPWRSEEQFVRKVRQGAEALAAAKSLEGNIGGHWRKQAALSPHETHRAWQLLLDGEGDDSLGWNPKGPFDIVEAGSWLTWNAPKL